MAIVYFAVPIILGLALWWFTRPVIESKRLRAEQKKRDDIFSKATPERIQDWLVNYYTDKNEAQYLYRTSSTRKAILVPLLTKADWQLEDRELSSAYVFPKDPCVSDVRLDSRAIERRKRLFGQRVWDQKIYIATRLLKSDRGICVEVGDAWYFQFLSSCGKLADEMIYAIYANKGTPYRDRVASSIRILKTFPCKAHIMGVHSVVVGRKKNNEYSLILHKRSDEVAINRGAYTGVPTFVFQPHCGQAKYDRNLLYSFLREYLEELYNKKEFVKDIADTTRPDTVWWFDMREAQEILKRLESKTAEFRMLGMGFETSNCDFITCVCLIVKDAEFWEKELREMQKNWEATKDLFKQEYMLYSDEIDDLIERRLVQPGTVYCIDKVRKLLRD